MDAPPGVALLKDRLWMFHGRVVKAKPRQRREKWRRDIENVRKIGSGGDIGV